MDRGPQPHWALWAPGAHGHGALGPPALEATGRRPTLGHRAPGPASSGPFIKWGGSWGGDTPGILPLRKMSSRFVCRGMVGSSLKCDPGRKCQPPTGRSDMIRCSGRRKHCKFTGPLLPPPFLTFTFFIILLLKTPRGVQTGVSKVGVRKRVPLRILNTCRPITPFPKLQTVIELVILFNSRQPLRCFKHLF